MESPGIEPFVRHHRRYDDWFERHRAAYLSELLAVRRSGKSSRRAPARAAAPSSPFAAAG